MAEIDLFTFVTKHHIKYAEYFKEVSEKCLSGKHVINWKCVKSGFFDEEIHGFNCVASVERKSRKTSEDHGCAIKEALDNHVESDYVIICDVDIVLTYKSWDDVIINKLKNGIDFFGFSFTEAELYNYKYFPTVRFMAFNISRTDRTMLDFSCEYESEGENEIKVYRVDDLLYSNLYQIKLGDWIHCDTGYRIPMLTRMGGLQAEVVEGIDIYNDENTPRVENKPHFSQFFYLNNKLFGSHFKKAYLNDFNSFPARKWRKQIKDILENE